MTCTARNHVWEGFGTQNMRCGVCGRWYSYARANMEMHKVINRESEK